MMDELELLKRDWRTKGDDLPKLSYHEIYKMIWKKSSSIVKWILIISILEITLPQLLFLLPSVRNSFSFFDDSDFYQGYMAISVVYYLVVVYFIYLFYKRYTEISVWDSAKDLMHKIILTRKTVFYYIVFSLFILFLLFMYFAVGSYVSDEFLKSIDGIDRILEKKSLEETRSAVFWVFSLGGLVFTVVMGGIYFLLYGLLLRRLHKNYKELKQLEV